MREIKFRAWDKDFNRMGKINAINWACDTKVPSCCFSWMEDGKELSICSGSLDRYVLMQYTGLKDKNGVEIYEGDIAKLSTGVLCVVQYADCWARYMLGTPPSGEDCYKYLETLGEHETYAGNLEVIGNIYENPELLEAK